MDSKTLEPSRKECVETAHKVSVIIPVYNGEKTIRNCLNSVLAQDFNDYEVIAVDSSTDNTPEIIKREFPQVELYHFDKRKSCGEAKNIGIEKSKGKYLFFLDDDKIVDKNWISQVLEVFNKQSDIKGLCASTQSYPEASTIEKVDHLLEYYHWLPCQKRADNTKYVLGGVSVYKREVFSKNKFEDVYGEDIIFSVNLADKGNKLLFEPSIRVKHINIGSRTFFSFIMNQLKIGYGSALTRKKADKSFRVFLKFPILIFLAPFYIVPKMAPTYLIQKDFSNFIFFLKYFPLFFMGNFFWAMGFFKEAIKKDLK